MATEILRPCGSDATGNNKPYPESTGATELYTLLNEIEPDDDSTYVSVITMFPLMFLFDWNTLTKYSAISKLNITCRVKTTDINAGFEILATSYNPSGTNRFTSSSFSDNIIRYCSVANTWETFTITVPDVDIPLLENTITNNIAYGYGDYMSMGMFMVTKASAKNANVYLTQLYIEVEYETGETVVYPVMYNKQSGTWNPVYGTVYEKVNGAWVEGDMDSLSDSSKVVLKITE